eukprot:m.56259 g.56259  ORF g.56259 m.56259 type:complete len:248 (-) comp13683_c0_seq37:108-851(-)
MPAAYQLNSINVSTALQQHHQLHSILLSTQAHIFYGLLRDISAVTYNGAAYILGGWSDINGFAQPFNDVHRFDGKAWEAFTPLLTARGDKVAMVLNDRLHVVGGELVGGTANVGMEVFEFATNRWTEESNITAARFRFSAAVLLGQLYVFGGQGNLIGDRDTAGSYFPISAQVERFTETDTEPTAEPSGGTKTPAWAEALIIVFAMTTAALLAAVVYLCSKARETRVNDAVMFDNPLQGTQGDDSTV